MSKNFKQFANQYLTIIGICLVNICISAQSKSDIKSESAFDFWIGKWEVSWKVNDTTWQKGINEVTKILDGKVIQEHFTDPASKFKGTSISVYNTNKNSWHQAWADNGGGYFNFIGEWNDSIRIFKTIPENQGNKINVMRMVFKDIQENNFTWDWEKSEDGGKTWDLKWQIFYKRL